MARKKKKLTVAEINEVFRIAEELKLLPIKCDECGCTFYATDRDGNPYDGKNWYFRKCREHVPGELILQAIGKTGEN